jgi:hypothetical protein
MKTTFISLMALGVAVAMAAPADRAAAGEPMVLTDAQLDRVTAGLIIIEMKEVYVTSYQTGGGDSDHAVSVGIRVPIRAIQNDKFLGGFEFTDGTYVKSVPEGGFDRAAR